jgi:threonine dehydrogenase-like Zn-dependent dehydrogenase
LLRLCGDHSAILQQGESGQARRRKNAKGVRNANVDRTGWLGEPLEVGYAIDVLHPLAAWKSRLLAPNGHRTSGHHFGTGRHHGPSILRRDGESLMATALEHKAAADARIPKTMRATVFVAPGRIELREKPVPEIGPADALVRVTTTTVCGTDVHIVKGEYPVEPGRTLGHEPVGVIARLGDGVTGYELGQRVIVGAITPCGQCHACLGNDRSQCGAATPRGVPTALGGWKLGNTIDGCQADYVRVPYAMANLTPVPDALTDEQVLMCPDILSTGLGGAERGRIRAGDTVVVFAQGPIGLCATAGARLTGATRIITVDGIPERLSMSRRLGADVTVDFRDADPVQITREQTGGRGADVAIEALGTPQTFESALRALRPGGVLSSLGVYPGKLALPPDAFAAGLGDHTIVTTLCPGGKERMRRLLEVVASGRVDLRPLVTHRFRLDEIVSAYDLFAHQRDGVLKAAVTTGARA